MKKNNSLLKNAVFSVLYRCLNIVFPFITSIYVARVLMPDSIGRVAAAQNLVGYFTIIASMGIPTYGIKLIAQSKSSEKTLSKSFWELFIINAVLSILSGIIYYTIINCLNIYREDLKLYVTTGLTIVFNIFNVDWFYQGIEEYGYIVKRSFFVKIISLILLILLVKQESDYVKYALIISLALVFNYVFNVIRLKKYICFTFGGLLFKEHIKHISTLFIATIAAEIYVLADITMLNVSCNHNIVGYYNMSMRVIKILHALVISVSAVFLPRLSEYYSDGNKDAFLSITNKGLHLLWVISLPVMFGIMLVSDNAIIVFFGSAYAESILTTKILAISILSISFSNFIGLQVMVAIGKEKFTTISTIFGAIANIGLNVILIQRYHHVGAAIASAVTEVIVVLIQWFFLKKEMRVQINVVKPLIASLLMIIAVLGINAFWPNNRQVFQLILDVIIGSITYLGVLYILKDEIINEIYRYIRRPTMDLSSKIDRN